MIGRKNIGLTSVWKISVLIVGLLLIGLPLQLTSCSTHFSSTPQLEKVTLQLKWYHQFQNAGYYAALEQGFYREAGLDVTIVEGGPFDTYKEVLSGRAQYGVSNTDIFLKRHSGKPFVVLAAIFQHTPSAFMMRQDAGIDNPQELAGRRIWFKDSIHTADFQAMLINEGISLDQVTLVQKSSSPSDYLFDENIDAFSVYATNEPFYWVEKEIPFTLIKPQTYGIDFYGDTLYTSETELATHPERVRLFREASLKGWQYAMTHPEEIVDLTLARYASSKSRDHLLYEAEMMQEYILPNLVEIGHMNPGRWEHIADTYVQLGMAEPGYSLDGFIYDPTPHAEATWIYQVLGILAGLLVLASGLSSMLYVFNTRLKDAVAQRTAALQRSEAQYRSLFDNALDAILIADDEACYVEINPAACQLLGYTREEFLSRCVHDLRPTAIDQELSKKLWLAFLEEGRQIGVVQLKHKAGPIIEVEYQAVANFLPGLHLVTIKDITDRKQAETALKESEELHRVTLESISDPVFITNDAGKFTFIGPNTSYTLGYSTEEVEAMANITALVGEPLFTIEELGNQQEFHNIERTITDKWGQKHAFLIGVKQVVINEGTVLYTLRDITKRKQMEEALQESETRFRAVWEIASDAMALSDPDGIILAANPAYATLCGHPLEKVVGQPFSLIYPPEERILADEGYQKVFTEPQIQPAFEVQFNQANGKSIFVESRIGFITNEARQRTAMLSILRDITQRKETEAALKESEEKSRHSAQFLQKIYNQTQVSVFVIDVTPDIDFRYVSLNPAHEALTGLTTKDVAGKRPEEVPGLTPGGAAYLRSHYARCVAENGPIIYEEHFSVHGQAHWWLTQLSPLWDDNGQIYQLIGSCVNITEQKQAEAQLRQLSQALEQSPDAVIITNMEGDIEYVNPAFTTISGYSFAEVKGCNPRFLKSGLTQTQVYKELKSTILAGKTYRCEFCNKKKNGELYWVQAVVSLIKDEKDQITHILCIQEDISERKRFEQKQIQLQTYLRQTQRLETIGTLAGGIAHDFNNILTPILGYTELTLGYFSEDDLDSIRADVTTDLERVKKAALRAKDLVRQILTFSRQVEQERISIALQPLIKEVLSLLRPSLPATIEICQEIAPECGPILADPAQLHQILMNLCTNAYQAMEENGGVLTIELTQVEWADLEQTLKATLDQDAYACLKITDTGYGMEAATLDRVFEPFFTTKPPGKGTGLGLSVVHGIVKSYEGAILTKSEPGQGTTFELYFPICAEATPVDIATIELPSQGILERILVVDDEPAIVELITQWLTKLGYQAIGQTSSAKVLDVHYTDINQFDLMITDLTMPHMTGIQLARKITSLRPDLPIILITGNGNELSEEKLALNGVNGILMKPILFNNLKRVIRQVLSQIRELH